MFPASLLLALFRGRLFVDFIMSFLVPTVSGSGSPSAIVPGASAVFFAFRRGLSTVVLLLVSEVGVFFVNRFFGFVTSFRQGLLAIGMGKNRERV